MRLSKQTKPHKGLKNPNQKRKNHSCQCRDSKRVAQSALQNNPSLYPKWTKNQNQSKTITQLNPEVKLLRVFWKGKHALRCAVTCNRPFLSRLSWVSKIWLHPLKTTCPNSTQKAVCRRDSENATPTPSIRSHTRSALQGETAHSVTMMATRGWHSLRLPLTVMKRFWKRPHTQSRVSFSWILSSTLRAYLSPSSSMRDSLTLTLHSKTGHLNSWSKNVKSEDQLSKCGK
mmetsp:Transcript_3779/g.14333  ORF Transcript_3779/g.14333 Transcript_3779/m.14333 type:complete len:230 (+) Transcript_3779:1868-2557(+)